MKQELKLEIISKLKLWVKVYYELNLPKYKAHLGLQKWSNLATKYEFKGGNLMWFLCKKAVLNNLRKGVILNVKNIQNICSRKRWCHVGCLPLKENTVAGFPPFGIWRFFGQMLKDISLHWANSFQPSINLHFFLPKNRNISPKVSPADRISLNPVWLTWLLSLLAEQQVQDLDQENRTKPTNGWPRPDSSPPQISNLLLIRNAKTNRGEIW